MDDPRTVSESREDSLLLPVPGQIDDECGAVDHPVHVLWSENQAHKASTVGRPVQLPSRRFLTYPEPSVAFEGVRVNSREIRDAFAALDAVDLEIVVFEKSRSDENGAPFLARSVPERFEDRQRRKPHMHKQVATNDFSCFFSGCRCAEHRGGGNIPKNKLISRVRRRGV